MIVRVWDLVAFEQVALFEVDGEQHIRVSPAGVLTDADLEPIAQFEVLTRVRDLSWSPDGSMLAVASRRGTTIWDPVAGELVSTFDEEFDALAGELADTYQDVTFTFVGHTARRAR